MKREEKKGRRQLLVQEVSYLATLSRVNNTEPVSQLVYWLLQVAMLHPKSENICLRFITVLALSFHLPAHLQTTHYIGLA